MSDEEFRRFRKLMAESAKRQSEALNLYEPLPKMAAFHASRKKIRLVVGGNRSSKTTSCVVEMARAFVGKDPFEKYPARAGMYFVFGIDAKHIGSVIYKKLFRAGAFKMVRDPKSMLWRSFNPVTDVALIKEAKPAPPLIPPRFIDWVVWDQKRAGIPATVVLKNGTEIHFFSINAEMPRGQDIDGAWIDEEAVKSGIVAEIMARLVDRGGRLLWSATPQSGGDQLVPRAHPRQPAHRRRREGHILPQPLRRRAPRALARRADAVGVHGLPGVLARRPQFSRRPQLAGAR
jgi:hypothetical protein